MSTQTVLLAPPVPTIELRTTSRPSPPVGETKRAKPAVYWGDRFTIHFWLVCFALMAGMNLVEVYRWLVFMVWGGTPTP